MNLLAKRIKPDALYNLIEKLKVKKLFIISVNYSYDFSSYPNLEIEFLDYFELFYTSFPSDLVNNLPIVDAEILNKYSEFELEYLFNDERIGRNIGLGWDGSKVLFDSERYKYETNRYLYSTQRKTTLERMSDYHVQLAFWLNFFTVNKIDLMISPAIPHLPFHTLAWRIAREKGVTALYVTATSVQDYSFIVSDEEDYINEFKDRYLSIEDKNELNVSFKKEYERITISEGEDFIPSYEKKHFERKINESKLLYKINKAIKGMLKLPFLDLINKFTSVDYLYFRYKTYNYDNVFNQLTDKLSETANLSDSYYYYPLHFQPEATSVPSGGRYGNQLLIIEMLSRLLPEGVKLFVKEHPQQKRLYRSYDFYQKIVSYKNVVLVRTSTPSIDLLSSCIATVTITGTVAWEGFGKGKPSLMFGFHPNILFKGAFRITNINECKNAITSISNDENIFNQEDLLIFIKFLQSETTNMFYYPSVNNKLSELENGINMSNSFIKKYNDVSINS